MIKNSAKEFNPYICKPDKSRLIVIHRYTRWKLVMSKILIVIICLSNVSYAEAAWTVGSPNGRLSVTVVQKQLGTPYSDQKNLYYRVNLDGKEVLPYAPLGVVMDGTAGDFVSGLTFVGLSDNKIDETYHMPVGKKSKRTNFANEKTLVFRNTHGKTMEIILRAYDDAIAWRYRFGGKGNATILSEATAFRFSPDTMGWLQPYNKNYEEFFCQAGKGKAQQYCFPALFKTSSGIWLLITEAAVYGDYAGARLHGTIDGTGIFKVKLPGTVSGKGPWTMPWRVAIIGDKIGTIVESVVVDNLNPPCEVVDLSWIKPGRVTFPWWSDLNVNGKYERLKEYVDFASQMGWEWIEFDTALMEGDLGGTDTWMTTPWVPELIKYAASRNVNVYGWDHWRNLDTAEKRDKIFSLFNKFGIKGIKIDFLDSDLQERFQFRDDAIKDCLKHKLMLSFHGATVPRGQQRRWPHIATWEAVKGAEFYMEWSKKPNTPSHNCMLPFTRNVVGSMDYTPVTFSTKRRKTTDAHELALSVIFESGWMCLADSPESYNANPAKQFLKDVHAAWDDIHFIDGYPGRFVCLARRKGNDWFVAGINTGKARTLLIDLDFIKPGTYPVRLYKDAKTSSEIAVEQLNVKTSDGLKITMRQNGGFAVMFTSALP